MQCHDHECLIATEDGGSESLVETSLFRVTTVTLTYRCLGGKVFRTAPVTYTVLQEVSERTFRDAQILVVLDRPMSSQRHRDIGSLFTQDSAISRTVDGRKQCKQYTLAENE